MAHNRHYPVNASNLPRIGGAAHTRREADGGGGRTSVRTDGFSAPHGDPGRGGGRPAAVTGRVVHPVRGDPGRRPPCRGDPARRGTGGDPPGQGHLRAGVRADRPPVPGAAVPGAVGSRAQHPGRRHRDPAAYRRRRGRRGTGAGLRRAGAGHPGRAAGTGAVAPVPGGAAAGAAGHLVPAARRGTGHPDRLHRHGSRRDLRPAGRAGPRTGAVHRAGDRPGAAPGRGRTAGTRYRHRRAGLRGHPLRADRSGPVRRGQPDDPRRHRVRAGLRLRRVVMPPG